MQAKCKQSLTTNMLRNATLFHYRALKILEENLKFAFLCDQPTSLIHTTCINSKARGSSKKVVPKPLLYPQKSSKEAVPVWRNMTVKDLADSLGKDLDHVFEALSFCNDGDRYQKPNQILDDPNIIKEIVRKSGKKTQIVAAPKSEAVFEAENRDAVPQPPASSDKIKPRPPVVTIMGHVDHGKTSLLDAIRNSRVVDTEFGGITQHIGAFTVTLPSKEKLTFLDTPGHAAFTAMRERGANVTDIVVLVVAADDGVMEQTIESIRMANNAKVPIIVAINKIDKPSADIERTKNMLMKQGVQVEDLGGDVQVVPVSALTGQGLSQLSDAIAAQAEILSLHADYGGLVEGVVLESLTDPGRGKLSTAIVKRGTLRKGSFLVAGTAWAKVRAMFDDNGKTVENATPSTAVQIIGWRDLPNVGETILQVESEKRANEVVRWRQQQILAKKIEIDEEAIKKKSEEHLNEYRAQLEAKRTMGKYRVRRIGPRTKEIDWDDSHPRVHVLIKGDVAGSVEAILDVLDTYDCSDDCKLDVIHYGVGAVSESDIDLASSFSAIVYAFNVTVSPAIMELAKNSKVIVAKQNVIYKLIDDLKDAISSKLPPKQVEEIIGEGKVQQSFMVSEGKKKVPVAGSRCHKGELKRDALYRIIRDGHTVYEGKLVSMRHLKNEVGTVKKDIECGLMFEGLPELESSDTLICYKLVPQQQTTKWDPGF